MKNKKLKNILMISNFIILLFISSCSIGIEKKQETNIKSDIEKIDKKTILKIKKLSVLDKLKKLDYKSDESITKYVDNKISFNNKKYIPQNLVDLKGKYLIDTKSNQKIRKIALDNLEKLSKDFYDNFGEKLKIVSAYRSYIYQKGIKDRGCLDIFCAKAGFSEHQSGLAVDFWEASEMQRFKKNKKLKKYFEWMKQNAYKYGFENSYQRGKEIDGYNIEPWHWRYVGNDLAKYLKENNLDFAEFYYKFIKK